MARGQKSEVRSQIGEPLQPPAEGGSYVIENGVRRRVEDPTADHPKGNANRDAAGKPVDHAVNAIEDSDAVASGGVGGAAGDRDGHPTKEG